MTRAEQTRRAERRRARLRQRLAEGMSVIEAGGTYDDAARAGGYADPFGFSKAVFRWLGARPRELRGTDWRALIVERTTRLNRAPKVRSGLRVQRRAEIQERRQRILAGLAQLRAELHREPTWAELWERVGDGRAPRSDPRFRVLLMWGIRRGCWKTARADLVARTGYRPPVWRGRSWRAA